MELIRHGTSGIFLIIFKKKKKESVVIKHFIDFPSDCVVIGALPEPSDWPQLKRFFFGGNFYLKNKKIKIDLTRTIGICERGKCSTRTKFGLRSGGGAVNFTRRVSFFLF